MSEKIKALVVLGIFTFMSTLDGSIVNIALPTMSRELNVSTSQITWVVTIYLIVISALVLIFGRLGDLIGKSRVTKVGWGIFIIGSLLAGINVGLGLPFLLLARVIQAVGASMFMATGFGIISEIFPIENRAKALSISSMFVSVGSITGPALGGLILQFTSWNYIFWINVPIGILAWVVGRKALPDNKGKGNVKDIDLKGSFLMMAVIISLFLALNFGQSLGWTSPIIFFLTSIGIILFILFVLVENKVKEPLLELKIFTSPLFSMSLLMALLNFTVAMFSSILLPFYLQNYKGYEPGTAGLIMMTYPIAMLIFSPIGGTFADKIDKEVVTFVGITGIVLSQLGYLLINSQSEAWLIVVLLFIQGMSMGIFQSPNNALVMETVERKYLGIAGSVNSLVRNVAFVLGTSLATLSLFTAMSYSLGYKVTTYIPEQADIFLSGFHFAFIFAVILVLLTWFLGLYRLINRRKLV